MQRSHFSSLPKSSKIETEIVRKIDGYSYCLRRFHEMVDFGELRKQLDEDDDINFITKLVVSQTVKIKGIIIANLILPRGAQLSSMEVDCLLMDSSGNVLSSSKVSKLPTLINNEEVFRTFDCVFNHPVTVAQLESYSINIRVSQDACFLSGMANSPSSYCQGVMFNFSTDEPLDGLVRGVIFST